MLLVEGEMVYLFEIKFPTVKVLVSADTCGHQYRYLLIGESTDTSAHRYQYIGELLAIIVIYRQ